MKIDDSKISIHQIPEKTKIIKALNIVIDTLDREKVYTKQQMLNVINNGNFAYHKCADCGTNLTIIFTIGEWSDDEGRYCVYSKGESLKGICLLGLFDGTHTITMKNKSKLHKTAFAHELLHYFGQHITGPQRGIHEPKQLWEDMVGFGTPELGILDEELKRAGF